MEQLDELTSILTMIDGKVAYEDPALRGNTLRFNIDTAAWTVLLNIPTDIWRWEAEPDIPPSLTGAGGRR